MSISRDDLLAAVLGGDRDVIDRIDDSILDMVEARRAIVIRIAREKLRAGVPFRDHDRETSLIERQAGRARGVSPDAARDVMRAVLAACREQVPD